jgi:hypothetical protein
MNKQIIPHLEEIKGNWKRRQISRRHSGTLRYHTQRSGPPGEGVLRKASDPKFAL